MMKKKVILLRTLFVLLISFLYGSAFAQRAINGKVVTKDDKALPGATIRVKGGAQSVMADDAGNFTLRAADGDTLLISMIGYATAVQPVKRRTGLLKITLASEQFQKLDEVVVTALGIKREKRAIGYSVQEIKGDQVNMAKDPNIVNSLSGKIAGVQVTSGGSAIGASARITIRGNSSLGDNTPLFVIDGTPVDNASSSLDGNGGVDYGNVTSDLDANDIASISVLKGPAAAALYGSRATNGAILITTKKGDAFNRNMGVELSASSVFDKPAYFLKFQNEYGGGNNGEEYIWKRDHPEMSYQDYSKQYGYNYVDGNGGGVNDANPVSWGPRLDDGLLLDQWSTGPNSPWVSRPNNIKDFFQTGNTQEQSLSVSSHGDKASGRLGYTRTDQKGILWNTGQLQNSLEGSLTLTPTSKMTAEVNVTYLDKSSTIPPDGYSGAMIDFGWIQRDFDTKYMHKIFEKEGNQGFMFPLLDNEYYKLTNTNTMTRDRVFGNGDVKYQITDWLSAMARIGTDYYNENQESITHAGSAANVSTGKGGQFSQTEYSNDETNADFILSVNKKFNDFHLDGLVGANYRDVQYKSMWLSAADLTVPDLFTISNVKGTPSASNYFSEKRMNSVYGSANLSYKDYLYLGVTGRNDWSSTLPVANRSYFYPSVSLGFVFTDALHIKSKALSYGKLRASWANVGGDTNPYQLNGTFSSSSFDGVSLFSPSQTLPPLNLKPQETKSYEFGANLGFFSNRVNLDVTYYDQKTDNQILSVPISSTTGYSSELINAGEIENRGAEVMLSADVLKRPSGLSWSVMLNWATNKNMVNTLYGGLQSYEIGVGPGGIQTMAVPGQPWGALYGLGYVRDSKGNIEVDNNGLPLTNNTVKKLGNVIPKWTGGLQNTFTYKRFQLGFLLDARWGSQFFSTSLWHGYATGTAPITVANNVRQTGLIVDGVTSTGAKNNVRVAAQDYYAGAWMWNNEEYPIIDGSFIKLRELSLSYPFDVHHVRWLHSVNLSLIARNVAILYRSKLARDNGIDPETGFGASNSGVGWEDFQLPGTRSFGLKLNVGL